MCFTVFLRLFEPETPLKETMIFCIFSIKILTKVLTVPYFLILWDCFKTVFSQYIIEMEKRQYIREYFCMQIVLSYGIISGKINNYNKAYIKLIY